MITAWAAVSAATAANAAKKASEDASQSIVAATESAGAAKDAATATSRQAELTERMLVLDHRPWIQVIGARFENGPVFNDPLQVSATIHIDIKNIGKTPAHRIVLNSGLFGLNDVQAMLDRSRQQPFPPAILPNLAFPDEELTLGQGIQTLSVTMTLRQPGELLPFFAGAVYYESFLEPAVLITGFAFRVVMVDGSAIKLSGSYPFSVSPDEIVFHRWPIGWFAQ